jgi:hypothetical protein
MTILRGIGAFIEDQLPGLLGGVAFGAGVVLILFLLFRPAADCADEVEAGQREVIEGVMGQVSGIVMEASLRIRALRFQLQEAQSNGPSGDSGIRMNESLGAYSDAAGEFTCFPRGYSG